MAKMGYENPFAIGYEIIRAESPVYAIESHGDLHATYSSMANADLPSYAHGFYSPSQHDQLSEVRYSKIEIGYDKGMRNFHEAVQGMPIEAYLPMASFVPDGSVLPKFRTEILGHEISGKAARDAEQEIEQGINYARGSSTKFTAIDIMLIKRIRIELLEQTSFKKIITRKQENI